MLKNSYLNVKTAFDPIYVPNETYSFYINFDVPITDPSFSDFRLILLKGTDVVNSDIGVLKKDFVSGIAYNIYCEFTFPQVKNGCYTFAIYDRVTDTIKCTSNCIQVENQFFLNNSQILQYRNKRNRDGFFYENLPLFYNKFRLPLNKTDFQYEVEKKQYRNISDKKLRNLYDYRDKFVKIESYYFDEPAHDAMSSVYQHNDITIDGTRYLAKDSYQVETSTTYPLSKGSVNAYEQERVFYPDVPTYQPNPGQLPEQLVSAKNKYHSSPNTITEEQGFAAVNMITKHVIYNAAKDFRFQWANMTHWYDGTYYADRPGYNNITIKATAIYNGVRYPISFGGQRTTTIVPGAILFSDLVQLEVPDNAIVEVRAFITIPEGGSLPSGRRFLTEDGEGYADNPRNVDITDVGEPVELKPIEGFAPTGIFAVPLYKSTPVVLIIGDSIFQGTGADIDTGGYSYIEKACLELKLIYLNLAVRGGKSEDFNTVGAVQRKKFIANQSFTDIFCNYGTNDITNPGEPGLQTKAALLITHKYLKKYGPVYQMTLLPKTESTDQWRSVVNQTPQQREQWRVEVNDYLRTTPIPLDAVIDVTAFSEVNISNVFTLNGSFWRINGTPNFPTEDGVHPSQRMYDLLKSGIISYVDSYVNKTPLKETPAAPIVYANDVTNVVYATSPLGDSEILVSIDNGQFIPYIGPTNVGDFDRPVGYVSYKIKAAEGRTESPVAYSPEFHVSTGNIIPDPPTNLIIDDVNDTAAWTNGTGYITTDHEYSLDFSGLRTWSPVVANPLYVGNKDILAGDFAVRVKEIVDVRDASLPLVSTIPFTQVPIIGVNPVVFTQLAEPIRYDEISNIYTSVYDGEERYANLAGGAPVKLPAGKNGSYYIKGTSRMVSIGFHTDNNGIYFANAKVGVQFNSTAFPNLGVIVNGAAQYIGQHNDATDYRLNRTNGFWRLQSSTNNWVSFTDLYNFGYTSNVNMYLSMDIFTMPDNSPKGVNLRYEGLYPL